MKYADLTRKHPEYRPGYWSEIRALYAGGERLLGDPAIMRRLFPKHANEDDGVYAERRSRALYINYAGALVDYIVAALCGSPVTMSAEGVAAPPFYEDFARAIDGRQLSLAGLLRQQVLTALQLRRAWTLVDLPPRDDGAVIESEADEEDAGALRAFALPIDPECILDWDESPGGDLDWALVQVRYQGRENLSASRDQITDRFTYYTREGWERYDVTYPARKPPKPTEEVTLADHGDHSFGRVPLARLELPEGLWAMNKLHGLARAHLNARSAHSWALLRSAFPILTAFLASEVSTGGDIPSEAGQDPGRAKGQVYGIGRVVQFGNQDRLVYTSPDSGIYQPQAADLDSMRDEMHRVVHQMALAANNSAAALGRSGESKLADQAAATVVLTALGELAREHAEDVFTIAAHGRRDPEGLRWKASGMDDFLLADPTAVADEHMKIDALELPSPTFQRKRRVAAMRMLLGADATPDLMRTIERELEKADEEPEELEEDETPAGEPAEAPEASEQPAEPEPSEMMRDGEPRRRRRRRGRGGRKPQQEIERAAPPVTAA